MSDLRMKASVIIPKQIAQIAVPNCIRNFLPFFAITLIVRIDIKAGKDALRTARRSIASLFVTTSSSV